MPANYIDSADAVPKLLQKRMFKKWKAKSKKISLIVNNRIQYKLEKFNPIFTFLFFWRIYPYQKKISPSGGYTF